MNTRTLGTLCIVGSLIAIVAGIRVSVSGAEPFDTVSIIAGILWAVGGISGLVGMIRLNAVGSGTVSRALAFVPIIGFVLLVVLSVLQLAGMITAENAGFGVAWMVQMVGMVLVGILTISAKIWQGWRRFVPLFSIMLTPVSFGIGAATDNLVLAATIIYLAWIVLGYAVATAEPVADLRPAHA
ncbi:MAG TPA: hypothetical protein VEZ12_00135 [Herpetosiphonaceae bacterium]|nr:hypothetical protein [Herpetosiphonaceae bacterium]